MDYSNINTNLTKYDKNYIALYSKYLLTGNAESILKDVVNLSELGHPDSIALYNIISDCKYENSKIEQHINSFILGDIHGAINESELLAIATKNKSVEHLKNAVLVLSKKYKSKPNAIIQEAILEISVAAGIFDDVEENLFEVRRKLLGMYKATNNASMQLKFALAKNLTIFDSSFRGRMLGRRLLKELSKEQISIVEDKNKEKM